MPASVSVPPSAVASGVRKSSLAPEKKYKCQFCNRAFSRSEHRSRHERSRTYRVLFLCVFVSSASGAREPQRNPPP